MSAACLWSGMGHLSVEVSQRGGSWSGGEPPTVNKSWSFSASSGSPAIVYAQVKRESVIVERRDRIHLYPPLTTLPPSMVLAFAQGSFSKTRTEV
jgi:hypothetical protein